MIASSAYVMAAMSMVACRGRRIVLRRVVSLKLMLKCLEVFAGATLGPGYTAARVVAVV
jgi:hypothetical protein